MQVVKDRNYEALLEALSAEDLDDFTKLALADWFEEMGDTSSAECMRWALSHGRRPFKSPSVKQIMYSWCCGLSSYGSAIPQRIFKDIDGGDVANTINGQRYSTAALAWEALFRAWKKSKQGE